MAKAIKATACQTASADSQPWLDELRAISEQKKLNRIHKALGVADLRATKLADALGATRKKRQFEALRALGGVNDSLIEIKELVYAGANLEDADALLDELDRLQEIAAWLAEADKVQGQHQRSARNSLESIASNLTAYQKHLLNQMIVAEGISNKQAAPPAQVTATWPPDNGWHFRPGEYAYDGTIHSLHGIAWKLLKTLATANRKVTADDLRESLGEDVLMDRNVVRSHLSQLRKTLCDHLAADGDPLPHSGRGVDAVWWLDLAALKTRPKVAQKRRSRNDR